MPLQDQIVASTIDPLFQEMIANTRIVGEFIRTVLSSSTRGWTNDVLQAAPSGKSLELDPGLARVSRARSRIEHWVCSSPLKILRISPRALASLAGCRGRDRFLRTAFGCWKRDSAGSTASQAIGARNGLPWQKSAQACMTVRRRSKPSVRRYARSTAVAIGCPNASSRNSRGKPTSSPQVRKVAWQALRRD